MRYDPEKLVFMEKSHRYKYNDNFVPSVTTILGIIAKPQLTPWAAKIAAHRFSEDLIYHLSKHDRVGLADIENMRSASAKSFATDGKAGARLGTLVHESIEDKLRETKKKTPLDALKYVQAFESWWKIEKKKYEVIALEHRLYHPQFIYAGTCDMILRNKTTGTVKIVDYKTSKRSNDAPYGIYPEYLVQAAAYAEAWNASSESLRDSCVETTILNVGNDGTYFTVSRDTFDISQDFQVFRQAQVLRENLKSLESFVKPEKKAVKDAS